MDQTGSGPCQTTDYFLYFINCLANQCQKCYNRPRTRNLGQRKCMLKLETHMINKHGHTLFLQAGKAIPLTVELSRIQSNFSTK